MLRMRVTSDSQVAIATSQTPKYQMPAPQSQNSTNSSALRPRNRIVFSRPVETKLS